MFQFRPLTRDASTTPAYAPHRDLLYLGPNLVVIAVQGAIDSSEKEPWYRQLLDYFGVSRSALQQYRPTLEGVFTRLDLEIKDALRVSGFSSLPPAIQAAFYIKLGQACLAALHCAVRDVATPDDIPPSIQRMLEQIKDALKKLGPA